MSHVAKSRLLYPYAEAAALLGLPSTQALRDLVYRGQGPVTVRVGRRVSFAAADLQAWVAAHRAPHQPIATVELPKAARRRGRPSVKDRQAIRG